MDGLNGHAAVGTARSRLAALGPYVSPEHPNEQRHNQVGAAKAKAPKRKAEGRFQVLNAFVDFSMAGLTRAEIATWITLYRDSRHGTARLSQSNIATRGGMSTRAVRLAVERLSKIGLLKIIHQGGLNKGVSTYQVLPLPDATRTEEA